MLRSRRGIPQRRDVDIQCCDVIETYELNVVPLRSNIATFQRVVTTKVATLGPTSRRSRGVVKIGIANIATLKSNVAT